MGVSVLDDLPAIGLLTLATTIGCVSLGNHSQAASPLLIAVAVAGLSHFGTTWGVNHRPERPRGPLSILLILIGMAWVGEVSGITSLLGALWGGILLSRLAPPQEDMNRTLSLLSEVFLPLYLIGVGMRVEAATLVRPQAWALASVLMVLGVAGKLACGLGISARDKAGGVDRWLIMFGLILRGLPGLVFATTALGAGVIDAGQLSALVIMVTDTTVLGLMLLEARRTKVTIHGLGLTPHS